MTGDIGVVFQLMNIGEAFILSFFKEFMDSISKDLQFAIDEISEEDTKAVGVTWHLGIIFIYYYQIHCVALSLIIHGRTL